VDHLAAHGEITDRKIARLESRMKCPRCGSRQVLIAFQPPSEAGRKRA
ncbi:MAG: hypothetical protein H0T75_03630, partial [Rhizobiales bacterium]|nr:hypothetical protein [Hyphomicrobiales bacterium]